MFLTDMKRDGIIHERQLDSLDSCFTGGHGRLRFDNLRIPASDVLGEIGKGSGMPRCAWRRRGSPLHALAGRRVARHRLRLCAHPRRLRQAAGRAPG